MNTGFLKRLEKAKQVASSASDSSDISEWQEKAELMKSIFKMTNKGEINKTEAVELIGKSVSHITYTKKKCCLYLIA